MIYIVTPYYGDFLNLCREHKFNPKDYNKVRLIDRKEKILGTRFKYGVDAVFYSREYDFPEEMIEQLRLRGYL